MTETHQPTLPGMPQRVVVAVTWEGPTRPATARATLDVPSDAFTSQITGTDVTGVWTAEELADVLCTLVYELTGKLSS